MADARSFEERQRDLIGIERAARLVGIEEIERQRRTESNLRAEVRLLRRTLEEIRENALAWHGPEGLDTGHARALGVIASTANVALGGPRG